MKNLALHLLGFWFIALIIPLTTQAQTAGEYSVAVSQSSYEVGETISVDWTAPDGEVSLRDWVGIFKTGDSNRIYKGWEYLNIKTTAGSLTLTENTPGTYEIRMFKGGTYTQVASSEEFEIVDPNSNSGDGGGGDNTYQLTIADDEISAGESVTVSWVVSDATNVNRDWVALYKTGASDRNYVDWKYTNGRTGSASFKINEPGTYEIRYLRSNNYDVVGVSETITVTAGGGGDGGGDGGGGDNTYQLTIADDEISAGESVTVSWVVSDATNVNRDWVALYKTGASDRNYVDWKYTNGRTGSASFKINEPGTYEIRYLRSNNYDVVGVSETITVTAGGGGDGGGDGGGGDNTYQLTIADDEISAGESVTVSWVVSDATNVNRDWVALYKTGASDRNYVDWKYTNGRTGSASFKINEPGTYEIRYLRSNNYDVVGVSETITVTAGGGGDGGGDGGDNSYSVVANKSSYVVGETARATWSSPSGAGIFLDWIGLYPVGASDTAFIYYEYVDIFSYTETFPLNRTGTFEFRFFDNNSYTKLATSDTFTVALNNSGGTCNGYDLGQVANYPSQNGPVIALGDSLTSGTGASANQGYVDELERRLNLNIINAGVPGETTRQILARLDDDVLDEDPSTVIVFAGGNDELRRLYESLSNSVADQDRKARLEAYVRSQGYEWEDVPLISRAETFANLRAIVNQIQSTGANTIIVGFDNIFISDSLIQGYENIAEETNSLFIDDIYDDVFGRSSRMSDLVHPNDTGYDIFADRIQLGLECLI